MTRPRARLVLLVLVEAWLLCTVAAAFWLQSRRDSAVVAPPPDLMAAPLGKRVFPDGLSAVTTPGKPALLAFLSPDCPCSQYNLRHLRHLIFTWQHHVDFVAVVCQTTETPRRTLDLPIPMIDDSTGHWCRLYGVHTTPRVVILDRQRRVYFHGNFNAGRYCDNLATEYARIALEALLQAEPCPAQPPTATLAYGCRIRALHGPRP